jgi:RNA polymerase sigma factor (sigma-70 family)
VAQSIHQCREGAAFRGWLFAIARNAVADELRARRFPTTSLADEFDAVDPAMPPEEVAIRAAQQGELRAARARCLDDGERELYDLLAQDLTYAEIAAALGRRVNAVRTRYWRLLDKLRRCLGVLGKGGGRVAQ